MTNEVATTDPKDMMTIEAFQYFEKVKSSLNKSQTQELLIAIDRMRVEIQKAHIAGQVVLVNELKFTLEAMTKELYAASCGYDQYIDRATLQDFLENVMPKNVIKSSDLARYNRIIPDVNLAEIQRCKSLGLFDEFVVIFTDLNDKFVKENMSIQQINKNRDPVVLGYFYNKEYNMKYDRYFLITDWEDEFCDLTFNKMIRKVSEVTKKPHESFSGEIDMNKINDYLSKELPKIYRNKQVIEMPKDGWISRIKKWLQ